MSAARSAVNELRRRGWTLGVAESLTGGSLSAEFVSVPGASTVFLGAVVAYATPVKHSLLRVDAELLRQHGPVHAEVARQMADGVRRAVRVDGADADVGVSTTGIAGPGSPDGQPVGTVHIGLALPGRLLSAAHLFEGDRAEIRARTVDAAVELLVCALEE
ncbi:CinA family protein [Microbacterium sp. 179-I 3D4 NHS]|uniref:CinA family protein n=1 Tax=Microbacterium sp. 179-I 3D4 NHS TaxID=3142381 RepID=UPI0039A310A0